MKVEITFFQCSYSATVWNRIADRCGIQALTSWEDTVLQLQALRLNRDSMRLTLLATQATVYWLWSERNSRLHKQTFRPPDTIISLIDKQIRNRLQSFRHANSRASMAMTQLWFSRPWSLSGKADGHTLDSSSPPFPLLYYPWALTSEWALVLIICVWGLIIYWVQTHNKLKL